MHLCVSIKRSASHANTVRQRGKKSENEKNRVTKIMAHKREKKVFVYRNETKIFGDDEDKVKIKVIRRKEEEEKLSF